MKVQWSGHALVTQRKLLAILERAAGGEEDFSILERALYTACEFWAAVESQSLEDFLAVSAAEQLRYAAVVYTAIGAHDIARSVQGTLTSIERPGSERRHQQCIARLQARLLGSPDPMDELIARFAQRLH